MSASPHQTLQHASPSQARLPDGDAVPSGLTGRHVLIAFCAMFGTIFLVNGIFLYHALDTYTGVVAVEPYRKGLAYNDRIAADIAQQRTGWTHQAKVNAAGDIEVRLRSGNGTPIAGATVEVALGRPSTAAFDQSFKLEQSAPGVYRTATRDLPSGNWVLQIMARKPASAGEAAIQYQAKERIWLKP